ncbi:MAG: carbohydrate kinase family protein [Candidatus Limnocylindria bacterium]
MVRVLACGGLTIDYVQTASARSGPHLGGNAAYAAAGAWLAGAEAEVVAVIGDDFPASLLDGVGAVRIGTSAVRRVNGPSFRVLLDESGSERIMSYLPGSGHNDRLDPVPSQLPGLRAGDGVHVSAIPTASQGAIIEAVEGAVEVITLDTVVIAGEIEPDRAALLELAKRVSVFLPSQAEVAHHWPGTLPDSLDHIVAAGVKRVIVKMGAMGSVGYDGTRTIRTPAAEATVVDSTGAGDAYCGAICARLSMGDDLSTAMAWAAAAASAIIESHGVTHTLNETTRSRVAARAQVLEHGITTSTLA